MSLPLVYDLDLPELTALLTEWGEPAYRARQIWEAVYKQLRETPADFSTLPVGLRQKLDNNLLFSLSSIQTRALASPKNGSSPGRK